MPSNCTEIGGRTTTGGGTARPSTSSWPAASSPCPTTGDRRTNTTFARTGATSRRGRQTHASPTCPNASRTPSAITQALGVRLPPGSSSICHRPPASRRPAAESSETAAAESDDWDGECGKMSDYFGSAYCTLAATSATNPAVDEGIPEPSKLLAARTCVLPGSVRNRWDPTEQKPGAFDDFAADVEGSELNKRAGSCRTGLVLSDHPLHVDVGVLGVWPRHTL